MMRTIAMMPAPQQTPNKPINVPLTAGTLPDFNTRLGNAQLLNMYVNDGKLYCLPGLARISSLTNIRAMHYTPYNNGAYIVVTNTAVYKIGLNGTQILLSTITYTGKAVKIDENLQNQITIVDGGGNYAYVYAQRLSIFTKIGATQGIDARMATIVGVVVINAFTILLSQEGFFQISDADNAISYPANYIAQMESTLTLGVGLATLDNNLYIFGTTGIERWEPGLTNPYNFPFTRDSNYRTDYGAVSAASIVRTIDVVYFLSNYYIPTELSIQGAREIISGDLNMGQSEKSPGIARILGSYQDVENCFGSFYTNKGNFFYQLTFLTSQKAWVVNTKNNIWCNSDDLITTAPQKEIMEVVATLSGIYQLTNTPIVGVPKHRLFIPTRFPLYKGIQPNRSTINGAEVRMVQGNLQTNSTGEYLNPNNQLMQLSFSMDGLTFGNIVSSPIGKTGERQSVTTWNTNITCQEITPKLEYWGDLDLCIENFFLYVK